MVNGIFHAAVHEAIHNPCIDSAKAVLAHFASATAPGGMASTAQVVDEAILAANARIRFDILCSNCGAGSATSPDTLLYAAAQRPTNPLQLASIFSPALKCPTCGRDAPATIAAAIPAFILECPYGLTGWSIVEVRGSRWQPCSAIFESEEHARAATPLPSGESKRVAVDLLGGGGQS